MLPDDIDPVSGFRLPFPDREQMNDDAKALYDRFSDPDGGSYVGLRGPGGIRLHSPELALRTQQINNYLRRDAGIPIENRELSILVTARELNSQFEWCAHEDEALKALTLYPAQIWGVADKLGSITSDWPRDFETVVDIEHLLL